MNFVLFLVLNAVLLLRPEELFPELAGARLYLITIVACVVASLPGLLARLTPDALRERPIGVCVLGLWAAGFISHLCLYWRPGEGMDFAGEFGKVVLYYFLLIAVVDTPARFRAFVGWIAVCVLASATIAMLDFHGYVEFAAIDHPLQTMIDPETGEESVIPRLASSGIYGDPNDLCLGLCLGMMCCAYRALSGEGGLRFLWLAPIGPLIYALTLTGSRGGVLGLLAGIAAWLFARYGGKRSVPLAVLAGIGLLAVVGGRGAAIGGGGTAHERVMIWASGFVELTRAAHYLPVGLGVGWFEDNGGLVAHNSFVSAYVETGLLGGGFFLGAFYIGARLVAKAGRDVPVADWARAARPFVLGMLVAYAGGAYSVSRQFVLPTYLALGLASAYLELTYPALPDRFRVSQKWWGRMALLSAAGFIALRLLTQALGQLGV